MNCPWHLCPGNETHPPKWELSVINIGCYVYICRDLSQHVQLPMKSYVCMFTVIEMTLQYQTTVSQISGKRYKGRLFACIPFSSNGIPFSLSLEIPEK